MCQQGLRSGRGSAGLICGNANDLGRVGWAETGVDQRTTTAVTPVLQRMPKGGDLHNHLSGAVYAESYLRWAAQDGKCIDSGGVITLPPCSPRVSQRQCAISSRV